MSTPPSFDKNRPLSTQIVEALTAFETQLATKRFWLIGPRDSPQTPTGLWDSHKRINIQPHDALKAQPFWFVVDAQDTILATLHSATGLLWSNELADVAVDAADAQTLLESARMADLKLWQLPTHAQLKQFATASNNPWRIDEEFQLKAKDGSGVPLWLIAEGCTDTDNGCWEIYDDYIGWVFACFTGLNCADTLALFEFLHTRNAELKAPSGATLPLTFFKATPQSQWAQLTGMALLRALVQDAVVLRALCDGVDLDPAQEDALCLWEDALCLVDYRPCRLPELDQSRLSDPAKGLWELWGEPPKVLRALGLVARDPLRDKRSLPVAIDFGTSSTTVARATGSGAGELLRIGVRDFFAVPLPEHFENPTVLECLDYAQFHAAWTQDAYRPALDWDTMRAAHEAQDSLRTNPSDTRRLACILPRLKRWALRSDQQEPLRLSDMQGHEMHLPPHHARAPVRGSALTVSRDDPFDPIELYAWYLGMAINHRDHGLFLKYYLSFPVKYPSEVKQRILASFSRGLQRSLPHSLISHHPSALNEWEVCELASEPAAYAAAALPALGIEPSETGVPYAVFDFGGGTSDFDYGLLRWASPEEDAQGGYEQVFEHWASSGDNYLGGENLIEHLVYRTFIAQADNQQQLRNQRIAVTQPQDASPYPGTEALIAQTQAAQTNTVLLATKLRPFMEADSADHLDSPIRLDLINSQGQKQQTTLTLNKEALDGWLQQRIKQGVVAFLEGLAPLCQEDVWQQAERIHILLAGNGCRSRHIRTLFDTEQEAWQTLCQEAGLDHATIAKLQMHLPLPQDPANPHAPTAKTGVALGLLRLAPGRKVLMQNHVHTRNDGQAPFGWYVGGTSRGQFTPKLLPGSPYGTWQNLGVLQQGVFYLYTSSSPRAKQGMQQGDNELHCEPLEFADAPAGCKLFARPTGPYTVELAAAQEATNIEDIGIQTRALK